MCCKHGHIKRLAMSAWLCKGFAKEFQTWMVACRTRSGVHLMMQQAALRWMMVAQANAVKRWLRWIPSCRRAIDTETHHRISAVASAFHGWRQLHFTADASIRADEEANESPAHTRVTHQTQEEHAEGRVRRHDDHDRSCVLTALRRWTRLRDQRARFTMLEVTSSTFTAARSFKSWFLHSQHLSKAEKAATLRLRFARWRHRSVNCSKKRRRLCLWKHSQLCCVLFDCWRRWLERVKSLQACGRLRCS